MALGTQQQIAQFTRRAMAAARHGPPVHALAHPVVGIARRDRKADRRLRAQVRQVNATWSMPMPWRAAMSRTHASLSATQVNASIPSSAARCSAIGLVRAVTSATAMPALRSSTSPWPSCTWNAFSSSPLLSKYRRPSVSVPSTSKQARRMRAARSRMLAG